MTVSELELVESAWLSLPDTMMTRLSAGAYRAPAHVQLLSWLLMLNGLGILRRLTISLPPGHSKSETTDVAYPLWLFERDPRHRIILSTYSGDLAEEWGGRVRNEIERNPDLLSVRVLPTKRATGSWRTASEWGGPAGGMWSIGATGGLTGRRASAMILDDLVKNWDSCQPGPLQRTWDWFRSTARTRLLPGAPIAVVMTRWSPDDLIGKLEAQDRADDQKMWTFVRLPAIAETDETLETVIGAHTCRRLEQLGIRLFPWRRAAGQALWPELSPGVRWFDETELAEIRAEVGEMVFNGLYQQRPTMLDGDLFPRANWNRVDALPAGPLTMVRRWDLAASESSSADWTAGVLMAMDRQRRVFIVDCRRERLDPNGVERFVRATAEEDRDRYGDQLVGIRIEREPGASGKMVETSWTRTVLPGFPVRFLPSSGSKRVRSMPLSAQQHGGNVFLVRETGPDGQPRTPSWFDWFVEEAAAFVGDDSGHDDSIDAASACYIDLLEIGPTRSKATTASVAGRGINPSDFITDPTQRGRRPASRHIG